MSITRRTFILGTLGWFLERCSPQRSVEISCIGEHCGTVNPDYLSLLNAYAETHAGPVPNRINMNVGSGIGGTRTESQEGYDPECYIDLNQLPTYATATADVLAHMSDRPLAPDEINRIELQRMVAMEVCNAMLGPTVRQRFSDPYVQQRSIEELCAHYSFAVAAKGFG